jgi:hypothetical protein
VFKQGEVCSLWNGAFFILLLRPMSPSLGDEGSPSLVEGVVLLRSVAFFRLQFPDVVCVFLEWIASSFVAL